MMKPESGRHYEANGPWLKNTLVGDFRWVQFDMTRKPTRWDEIICVEVVREFERIVKDHAPWLDVTGDNR